MEENKKIRIEITIPHITINIQNTEISLTLIKIFDLDHVDLSKALDVFKEEVLRAYNYNLNKS